MNIHRKGDSVIDYVLEDKGVKEEIVKVEENTQSKRRLLDAYVVYDLHWLRSANSIVK